VVPASGWVRLKDWCQAFGLPAPHASKVSSNWWYGVSGQNGRLDLVAGRRQARWGNIEVWLGFPPRRQERELAVHHLDAQNTLLPLLVAPRLEFTNGCVVVLDPGHGGEDPGANSVVENKHEKDYTLDWARRLEPLLEAQGWEVRLTRTNDVDLSLSDRVAWAEQNGAALFVSLHFNSAVSGAGRSGLESYCLTPQGLPSSLLRGQEDLQAQFPNNAFDSANVRLAVRLHHGLVEATTGPDRGVRRARFMGVLRGQNRPAVLLEGGYLSSPADARLIATPAHRQKLAEAVAKALGVCPAENPAGKNGEPGSRQVILNE
jgi:N-acetylmuramoyl-L-alanine amidase